MLALKGVFAKLAMQAGVSIDVIILYRYIITLPLMWLFGYMLLRRQIFTITLCEMLILFFLGFLGYYLGTKFDFIAVEEIGANISRLILYTYPAFVLRINAFIVRKFPSRHELTCLALVQLGLVMLLIVEENVNISSYGIIFALLSAFVYALYIIIIQQYGRNIASIKIVVYSLTFATLSICGDIFFSSQEIDFSVSGEGLWWIAAMALFSTFIPLTIFAEAIKRIGGSQSAIISSIGPFVTVIFAYVLLSETMTYLQLLGGFVVVGSIYYLSKKGGS